MAADWKKSNSRIVHENPWYSVREDDVIRPDGREGKYFVVDMTRGAIVVARDSDRGIYLVEQERYPIGERSWELVMGTYRDSDDIRVTAETELRQEAGLVASNWEHIGYVHPNNGWCSQRMDIFVASGLEQKDAQPESTEKFRVRKFSEADIHEMIRTNIIHDGPTIAAMMKYSLKNKR